ncbi:GNAT family N-acetyltransferase [Salinispora arenicola]|uniref:GNAT family N-acetyltransferase n=1 Tax=Salinispora arenicola TaxID=168697 RepID=UPI00037CD581|nr:GNAT family N-acetyltransferase [Salinispora arenicola]
MTDGAARSTVQAAYQVADIPIRAWTELATSATLFSQLDWLEMRHGELPAGAREFYPIVLDGQGAAGALTAYAFDVPPHPLYDPRTVFAQAVDEDRLAALAAQPVVIGAGWSEFRGEILLRPDLEPVGRRATVDVLGQELECFARSIGAEHLIFAYVTLDEACLLVESFGAERSLTVFNDLEAVVRIRWQTFDDFLADLSANRRKKVRRELRDFAASGRAIRELQLSEAIDDIAALSSSLMSKYGHDYTPARARAVFARQARVLDGRSSVLLAGDDEGPTGFALRYRHGREIYSRVGGYAYDRPTAGEYFVLKHQAVEKAIRSGCDAVHLGQGTLEAKLRRGASPVPLYSVLVALDTPKRRGNSALDVSRSRLGSLAEQFGTTGPCAIEPDGWLPPESTF